MEHWMKVKKGEDIIKQAIQRVILTVLAAFAEKERTGIKIR
ncbi:hypothetical protein [Gracilibacillus boraciitolerans]|nr:hypothetical protein [Gracilibacillus boraciitolerans]